MSGTDRVENDQAENLRSMTTAAIQMVEELLGALGADEVGDDAVTDAANEAYWSAVDLSGTLDTLLMELGS